MIFPMIFQNVPNIMSHHFSHDVFHVPHDFPNFSPIVPWNFPRCRHHQPRPRSTLVEPELRGQEVRICARQQSLQLFHGAPLSSLDQGKAAWKLGVIRVIIIQIIFQIIIIYHHCPVILGETWVYVSILDWIALTNWMYMIFIIIGF